MDKILLHSTLIAISWIIAGCAVFTIPDPKSEAPRSSDGEFPAKEALSMIESGALIIDVRTPEEFSRGHLENAVNIPVTRIQSQVTAAVPDKGRPVVVYCQSGRRAEVAKEELTALGYRKVVNGGGMAGLQ